MAGSGKPEDILEKIAVGKLGKFYEESCLLEQPFVKEPKTKVEDLIKELSGQVGEKIDVRRFERFQLGEGIEKAQVDFAKEVAQLVAEAKGN